MLSNLSLSRSLSLFYSQVIDLLLQKKNERPTLHSQNKQKRHSISQMIFLDVSKSSFTHFHLIKPRAKYLHQMVIIENI